MADSNRIAHIAIPCRDLAEAKGFYGGLLGCRLAREYGDRITLDFFGAQVVCHLCPEGIDPDPKMYPRHFGVTFLDGSEFEQVLELARRKAIPFFAAPFSRFEGTPEVHRTFFLKDPSNNLIEFKWYLNAEMSY